MTLLSTLDRLAVVLLLLAPALADRREQGPGDAPASGLLAGVARVEINPPAGIVHLNWGSQTHVAAEGIDPAGMKATALVISDGRQKFAMVDIDTLGVQGLDEAIGRASAQTGIPARHIRLAATHTHSGPMLSRQRGPLGTDYNQYEPAFQEYRRRMVDRVVEAIVEADRRLKPAHLYGARGIGTININRRFRASGGMPAAVGRNPEGFLDRDLSVVRIDDGDGKPIAVLVNYQCHGTVLAYENRLISPDWIGMTRQVVEQALPGALCLYFQGAAGNQGPVEGFTGDLRVAHRLGSVLGHQAAALALGIETVRREPRFEGFVESTAYQAKQHWRVAGPRDSPVRFASRRLEVPRRRYTPADIDEMETRIADAQKKVEEVKAAGDAWKLHQAEARLRRVGDLLTQWRKPHDGTPIAVDIEALRIGEVAIFAMPGEPFAEIGAAVKQGSPLAVTLFCGYSSGAGGDYMPVPAEYSLGGYEVERTPYAPEAAGRVIAAAVELLRSLR